jgi:3-hydroxymyristoyl/3-hydroxydecanoyl-(acyl carrier protein) dehydratase
MLASGKKILELIPQRPPMVMVDELLLCAGNNTVTTLNIREDNVFISGGTITSSGLMEAMAQTAAVRTGWLMKMQPDGENKKIPVGVIGSIKNFKLHFQPFAGTTITTTVEVLHEIMQATIVKAKVEADGKLAAEAEMQIFLTDTEF